MGNNHVRLSVLGLGISLGLVWAITLLILAAGSACLGIGDEFVKLLGSLYVGYDASLLGSLIGFAWGFVDAFVGGVLIALVYNGVTCCLSRRCKKD